MTSSINLSVFEVLGPKIKLNSNYNKEYSFGPLSLRNNLDNITPIIPKNLALENRLPNKNKLFSPNIIKNITVINNSTKSKNTESKRSEDNINLHKKKNKELEINFNNIPFLYKIYKTFPARIKIEKLFSNNFIIKRNDFNENIYKKIPQLINHNSIIFHKYFINNTDNYKIKNNDCEIIYNLYENENSNIIITGDNHGGFHSFFRIILRLYIQGIITSGYKLKNNYKLILTGDLVDRGNYGVELLYILLNLMKTNNTEVELKVILIRGNHEEPNTYYRYGFYDEFMKKIPHIHHDINNFFTYCPSAIILNHLETRYWLCHGGFSTNIKDYKKLKKINYTEIFVNELLTKKNTNNNNNTIVNNVNNINNGNNEEINMKYTPRIHTPKYTSSYIRWNDFSGTDEDEPSSRGEYLKEIGNNTLKKFLDEYDIDFIIRGHNDDYSNAMLLMKKYDDNIFFFLNDVSNMEYYENNKKSIIEYKYKNRIKSNTEILSIYPKEFKKDSVDIGEFKLFPVLTISNNCDNGRSQYSDSFIIICKPTIKAFINNNVKNNRKNNRKNFNNK